MSQKLAPIVIFAFNRPDHFELTVNSLLKNKEANDSDFFLFIDGARNDDDRLAQQQIDQVIVKADLRVKFKSFQIIRAPQNKGLANSIVSGVTRVVNEFGKVIVLEDDMILSSYFLKYMNDALQKYEFEERVISVHGYNIPTKEVLPETFFLRGADCWGWGTWKRGWALFEPNGKILLRELRERKLEKFFNFDNHYPYIKMLKDQINGRNNSWAIRWQASAFLQNKLTLYPAKSLVENIGLDGSGTHGDLTVDYDVDVSSVKVESFPSSIEHSRVAYQAYCKFFTISHGSLLRRIFIKLKNIFKMLIWRGSRS